ncbi:exonuclease SbcCD subunit D [Mesobacterium pallidum]|uniref:exonuclease SbcCD subunit D n=1 Tax=Mesobacterium pallidum TaxID=2872037 RepID=UPI001EE25EB5|nr:exonuclease SbcCD subunit D [Mesobacterium pallidum]
MKFLHTADLHLGRQFNGLSLEDDHAAILAQVVEAVKDHDVDALVVAGDIYDRAAPPATAVRMFNAFLTRIATETRAVVVMISGNHDSGDRIEAMSILTDARRALIRGVPRPHDPPLVLHDAHGPVAFSALPFAYEFAAREVFGDETLSTPADVLAAEVAAARAALPTGARWVITAHAFVTGARPSDGERSLVRVGGVETVGAEVFDGAAYVALGHLHRPQAVGAPHIRYSGSPLAFGFDEAGSEKSMSLVDLAAGGSVTIDTVPFAPPRGIQVLRGKHAELLLAPPTDDFVKAVLTDEVPVIDGMKRLRAVFPNACELSYESRDRAGALKPVAAPSARFASPLEVLDDFLTHVRDEGLTEAERAVATEALGTPEDAA